MCVCVCVCVCCIGAQYSNESKSVSETEQVNAARSCSDSYLQILEPMDTYFSSLLLL